jgi:hypothetical protein
MSLQMCKIRFERNSWLNGIDIGPHPSDYLHNITWSPMVELLNRNTPLFFNILGHLVVGII